MADEVIQIRVDTLKWIMVKMSHNHTYTETGGRILDSEVLKYHTSCPKCKLELIIRDI